MSFQPLPPAPPPPPPPVERRRRGWVWPLVAVLALTAGGGAGVAVGMAIDDDESDPVAQETSAPDETEGGDSDELEQLRERLEAVEQQRDDLKQRLDEARAELDERETEPPAEEEPLESEPTPFEGEFTDGVFTFTDVQVLRDFAGDFEVRATVTNTGDETVDFASWTATVLYEGEQVSTLTTTATELAAGDSVDAQFIGFDDYGDWDAVEFAVDSDTDQT